MIRWSLIAALVAAWPGLPLVVERRLILPGAHRGIDELLLVGVEGADLLADVGELRRGLTALFSPVLHDTGALALGGPGLSVRARLRDAPRDIAELRSFDAVSGCLPGRDVALQCTLDCLAATSSRATVSVLLGSPGLELDDQAPGRPEVALAEALLEDRSAFLGRGQLLRCCLRLTSDRSLADAALAHAGVFGGALPSAWCRPRACELSAAAVAARGATLSTWSAIPSSSAGTAARVGVELASARASPAISQIAGVTR